MSLKANERVQFGIYKVVSWEEIVLYPSSNWFVINTQTREIENICRLKERAIEYAAQYDLRDRMLTDQEMDDLLNADTSKTS